MYNIIVIAVATAVAHYKNIFQIELPIDPVNFSLRKVKINEETALSLQVMRNILEFGSYE